MISKKYRGLPNLSKTTHDLKNFQKSPKAVFMKKKLESRPICHIIIIKKSLSSRKGQRPNENYRSLVCSDQQMQRQLKKLNLARLSVRFGVNHIQ